MPQDQVSYDDSSDQNNRDYNQTLKEIAEKTDTITILTKVEDTDLDIKPVIYLILCNSPEKGKFF